MKHLLLIKWNAYMVTIACTFLFLISALSWVTVAMAMVGKLLISLAFGVIFVYTGELFPTVVRSVALGASGFGARIASPLTPYLYLLVCMLYITVYTGELFPTVVRSVALGVSGFGARIASPLTRYLYLLVCMLYITVYTGELFPTVVRSVALGVSGFGARIASPLTPYLYLLVYNKFSLLCFNVFVSITITCLISFKIIYQEKNNGNASVRVCNCDRHKWMSIFFIITKWSGSFPYFDSLRQCVLDRTSELHKFFHD